MSELIEFVMGLPPAARLALLALVLVQIGLQVHALLDLSRRSRVAGGRKWVWVAVIVLGNLLGALLYLALGRAAAPQPTDAGAGDAAARDRAVDRLYGDRDRS